MNTSVPLPPARIVIDLEQGKVYDEEGVQVGLVTEHSTRRDNAVSFFGTAPQLGVCRETMIIEIVGRL